MTGFPYGEMLKFLTFDTIEKARFRQQYYVINIWDKAKPPIVPVPEARKIVNAYARKNRNSPYLSLSTQKRNTL